jgi:ribosome-binding protein aMBF1 (putative translation factor)
MDEELIGQLREVSGDRIVTCDLCGRPTSEVSVVVLERISPADPEAEVRVCPACRRQMEADDLPITIEDGLKAGPEES